MKTSYLISFFAILAMIPLIGCVSHQHKGMYYDASFEQVDETGDGKADMDEFREHFPEGKKQVFMDADADGDGTIYPDEWFEFREKHGYEKP